jgi:hypothetical protein
LQEVKEYWANVANETDPPIPCPCGKDVPTRLSNYCSVECWQKYHDVTVEVETEGVKLKGVDLGDGCIKVL